MVRLERAWITWEVQRRSLVLADHFNCRLFMFVHEGPLRYLVSIIKTVVTLLMYRPKVLVVQNPSMILAVLACTLGRVTCRYVVVDRHTTFRLNKPQTGSIAVWVFMRLHYLTLKLADLTIVTNDFLAGLVERAGGRPFVLPDKIPNLNPTSRLPVEGRPSVFVISSFGNDEPVAALIDAANILKDKSDCVLYVSGNPRKLAVPLLQRMPENIRLTGFVPESDFVNHLFACDIGMALTTADACLLCGCYEVVAAEKPLITSKTVALEGYFRDAIHVDNTGTDIAAAVIRASHNLPALAKQAARTRSHLAAKWALLAQQLESRMGLEARNAG